MLEPVFAFHHKVFFMGTVRAAVILRLLNCFPRVCIPFLYPFGDPFHISYRVWYDSLAINLEHLLIRMTTPPKDVEPCALSRIIPFTSALITAKPCGTS